MGEIRMIAPNPPKNGTLETVERFDFVDYGETENYKKCTEKRTNGLSVYYQAKENYKGDEKFSLLIVYSDGSSRRYEIDMTIY